MPTALQVEKIIKPAIAFFLSNHFYISNRLLRKLHWKKSDGDREVYGFLKLGHRNSCERHSQGQSASQILTTTLQRFCENAQISSGSFTSLMKAVYILSISVRCHYYKNTPTSLKFKYISASFPSKSMI